MIVGQLYILRNAYQSSIRPQYHIFGHSLPILPAKLNLRRKFSRFSIQCLGFQLIIPFEMDPVRRRLGYWAKESARVVSSNLRGDHVKQWLA